MPPHRLFIALRPPAYVQDALLDSMEGIAGARWQDAENLHITLRFVGEVERHQANDLISALDSVPCRPFQIEIKGVGHFAGPKHARAVWAKVRQSNCLTELQQSVEMACRRAGLHAETRKFIPHITIARLNAGSAPIGDWLNQHGRLSPEPWTHRGFALFESNLTPQGPIYSEIATFAAC